MPFYLYTSFIQVHKSQMVHNHQPLSHADSTMEATDYEFVGQTCPGLKEGDKKIDWDGCWMDRRQVKDRDDPSQPIYIQDEAYSEVWRNILLKTC